MPYSVVKCKSCGEVIALQDVEKQGKNVFFLNPQWSGRITCPYQGCGAVHEYTGNDLYEYDGAVSPVTQE